MSTYNQQDGIAQRMEISRLYTDLIKASAGENLNRITGKLIELYKEKNYFAIRQIAARVSEFVPVSDEKDSRCFSKLLKLYHPDKAEYIKSHLNQLHKANNLQLMQSYRHFFLWEDMEKFISASTIEDIDYQPEYVWDDPFSDGEYNFDMYGENYASNDPDYFDFDRSFYNLLKLREYGDLNVNLPGLYLQSLDQIEMVLCDMESLDGIEFCLQTRVLDVSDNFIPDLEKLWGLERLEELYIANNQICYLDVLSNLTLLRIIDISGNQIEDISPLYELENLQFLYLAGNPVPAYQIEELSKKGVLIR